MASSGMSLPFTVEQIEAMAIVFDQFPNPSAAKIREIKRAFPVLSNLDSAHIKAWFQMHRILIRQMESSGVRTVREMLTITNHLLNEEHSALMRQMQELLIENAILKELLREEDM